MMTFMRRTYPTEQTSWDTQATACLKGLPGLANVPRTVCRAAHGWDHGRRLIQPSLYYIIPKLSECPTLSLRTATTSREFG
jgi:hypothetical protein